MLDLSEPLSVDESYIYILKENIRRTHGWGLYLQIRGKNFSSNDGLTHPALQVLFRHSEKWCNLQLTDCSQIYPIPTSSITGRIRSLSRIKIQHTSPVHSPQVVGFLAKAPALAVVHLIVTNGHKFHLPTPNIRRLCYRTKDGLSTHELQAAMSSSKVLTHLTLSFKGHGHIGTGVALPLLERLDIDFNGSEHGWFIDNIITPSITHLIILKGRATITSSLRRMLHRSNQKSKRPSKLHTMELRAITQLPGQLTSLLPEAPNVKWLRCVLPHVRDLEALTRTSTVSSVERVLAPTVTFVFFEVPNNVELVRIKALKSMAHSRCNIGTRINSEIAAGKGVFLKNLLLSPPFSGLRKFQHRLECWSESLLSQELSALSSCLWCFMPTANINERGLKDVVASLLYEIDFKTENAKPSDITVCRQHSV